MNHPYVQIITVVQFYYNEYFDFNTYFTSSIMKLFLRNKE